MTKRVLAIGECMAELAPAGQAGQFSLGFAGDTFNTAWYLAQLVPDIEVSYLTAIGVDRLSEAMLGLMRQSGIKTKNVARKPGATIGLYMIHLDKGERSFTYWRSQSAARHLAEDPAALDGAMAAADLIYFSGITLAILNPKHQTNLMDVVRSYRHQGKTVVFDTNLRPRLWPSLKAMQDCITQAATCADIVLPSFDDEAAVFGDADPQTTLHRYRALGAKTVIVKNGAKSVIFHDGTKQGLALVEPVPEIVDSTSAGDSFNAGFLAGLLAGQSHSLSITDGCNLARHVVQHYGALVPVPSLPSRSPC